MTVKDGTTALRINADAQASLVKYCNNVLQLHQRMSDVRQKMEFIDIAYARYNVNNQNTGDGGVDSFSEQAGNQTCGINNDEITVPVVVSQVDSYVGYFADIFLSGFPMFPVVSDFSNREYAEQLETIIDDHSIRGRYPRHLLLNFRDAAKYNLTATEVEWCPLDIYNVAGSFEALTNEKQQRLQQAKTSINKLKRIDPYNFVYDYRVHPVDVPYSGEYAGYIEVVSRVEVKRRLQYLASTGYGYNTSQAMASSLGAGQAAPGVFGYYTMQPQISNLIANRSLHKLGMFDWMSYLNGEKQKKGYSMPHSDTYEWTTLYVRLIPEEHKMDNVPRKGTPQVWKLEFMNHSKLVSAKRVYSLYEMIPIFVSQPFEDGFDMQTQSLAESGIPFQEASSKLFSIRLNAARRAVMDRAIYDPKVINPSDINSPVAAPKIPIRDGALLSGKTLQEAYLQIPFDSRGTETVVQDMNALIGMADKMNGLNQPMQGQFQKGNKTRKEFDTTMQGSNQRMRLPALAMEYQLFIPIKEQVKLNIYQYGVQGVFNDQRTGKAYNIDAAKLEEMRKRVGAFKIADGFHPAEKMASSDVLTQGMQFISQSPILQQTLGIMLPQMFIHLMSLGGVKGLEQYLPQQPQQMQQQQGPQGAQQPAPPALESNPAAEQGQVPQQ